MRRNDPVAAKVRSAPSARHQTLAMRQARKKSAIINAAQITPAAV